MDTRLTADQTQLHDALSQLTADLGPATVAALDDGERRARLSAALEATGVRMLREPTADGLPLASAVEAAVAAEALGAGPADSAFVGPLLAGELLRLSGATAPRSQATVALTPDLTGLAEATEGVLQSGATAIDADGADLALVGSTVGGGFRLAEVHLGEPELGTDLTRRQVILPPGTPVTTLEDRPLPDDGLPEWVALGLAVSAADAVGAMQGAVRLACEYAAERQQYGATIGSFQAVQHLLAEAHTLVEGSVSISRHAGWAVDALEPPAALSAAAAATVYVGRAARTVGETVIQVHGGIGHTWECMAHVFLRRTLHDDALLGGAGRWLEAIANERTGAAHGLS